MSDRSAATDSASGSALEEVFRRESGQILATLIRATGDFDLAEDALADAVAVAVERWPEEGVPANPGGWLTTTARRRAIDRIRRDRRFASKLTALGALYSQQEHEPVEDTPPEERHDGAVSDDRLRLIFTCCHPALSTEARVALTLRTLGGLTTPEIARAFLVAEPTMAQRIVRAKRKIRDAGIPYRIPPAHLLPERLASVLAVVYLIFNEGYSASEGERLVRTDLAEEAIRLGRVLADLMPAEPEALGLLALMLLHHARREARTDAEGDLVTLEAQDRSRWDDALISEGQRLLDAAMLRRRPGSYQVQAAIAALHDEAAAADETDWSQIAALYGTLERLQPSPVVALNRAVAIAMAESLDAGLSCLDGLAVELEEYHLWHAARADLLRRAGRHEEAAIAYAAAIARCGNEIERRYLERRLVDMGSPA